MSLNEPGLAGLEPLRGGPEALQKVGLSLKDDGAAGTCPGNASPCSRPGAMPRSQSKQRLRGLLRPRPGFSRLPFGEPCLSVVSPEALPAASAEVSRVPALLLAPVRAGFSGNHSFSFCTGVRPSSSSCESRALPAVGDQGLGWSPGDWHRSAFEPNWWDSTLVGQVCWHFLGFILREMIEGRT